MKTLRDGLNEAGLYYLGRECEHIHKSFAPEENGKWGAWCADCGNELTEDILK